MAYITKDKFGQTFKWSKKGKNRECWVKDTKCIIKECFKPDDCGTIDQKTQQKNIVGVCRTFYDGLCPLGYDEKDKNYLDMTDDKIYR